MSRQNRHERRHHRDDIEDRYQEEEEEDRRYRRRDEDHDYRHNHGFREYDEERSEVERAPSDRALSEFVIDAPRYNPDEQERYDTERRGRDRHERDRYDDRDRYDPERGRYDPEEREASEIYAEAHQPMSHYAPSHRTHRSGVSDAGTTKTKTSRHGNLMMETMAAPHPCCPNTKGVCCLMLLLNLAVLLIALGFVIILQLIDPPFVWFIGLTLLIGGFCALIFCLVYCVWVCRDAHRAQENGELYWTHHWQKQWGYQPSEKAPSEPYRERY